MEAALGQAVWAAMAVTQISVKADRAVWAAVAATAAPPALVDRADMAGGFIAPLS
jgi:hypothetical protein